MIMSDFGGEVPHTMDELCRLPGVGRKTANIVLNKAFGIVEGIAVDTHVYRIATRLRLTNKPTPLQAEQDLLATIPRELWGPVNEQWIHFGRDTCRAQNPKCDECPMTDICPSAFKAQGNPQAKRRTTKTKTAPSRKGTNR
jgi:endonuclease-3